MNSIYLVSLTQLISELHDVAQRVTKKIDFFIKILGNKGFLLGKWER